MEKELNIGKIRYKYNRSLLGCQCMNGSCRHFNKKLCNRNYKDSLKDVKKELIKEINAQLKNQRSPGNLSWVRGII